ncbi:hypothetical protein GCM10025787_29480 [Saccharopolyspora rosea]
MAAQRFAHRVVECGGIAVGHCVVPSRGARGWLGFSLGEFYLRAQWEVEDRWADQDVECSRFVVPTGVLPVGESAAR